MNPHLLSTKVLPRGNILLRFLGTFWAVDQNLGGGLGWQREGEGIQLYSSTGTEKYTKTLQIKFIKTY